MEGLHAVFNHREVGFADLLRVLEGDRLSLLELPFHEADVGTATALATAAASPDTLQAIRPFRLPARAPARTGPLQGRSRPARGGRQAGSGSPRSCRDAWLGAACPTPPEDEGQDGSLHDGPL